MLRVGITGGIGSGKSTVCHIFSLLGIPVYDADSQAKWLMTHDNHLRQEIGSLLGAMAYLPDGALDRAFIAKAVFGQPELLSRLNALVHPVVGRHGEAWHEQQTNTPYTLYEAALLLESGGHKKMDRLITVSAPLELRIQRVVARDHTDRAAVEARIARQMPETQKIKAADYVITNDGEHSLIEQVLKIHRDLCTESELSAPEAHLLPPPSLPFFPFRRKLYTWQELMEGFLPAADNSLDLRIYQHFKRHRFAPPMQEALWQRIHDHAMDTALRRLLDFDSDGMSQRKCVGIMGGHGVARTDLYYYKTVETAKLLTENGYFVVSGGGPGIMEAANLGAYLAGHTDEEVQEALQLLAPAPKYHDTGYHDSARRVLASFPNGQESLAIPTWFYGHEPSNLFASHIAKYFSNSLREDTLLAIALHGIVYAPGSAGTTQEIFMDAAQNHYGTFNYYSPMVFLGRQRYEIDTLLYPLLKQLAWSKPYEKLLYLTDEPKEIVHFLQANPPIKCEV